MTLPGGRIGQARPGAGACQVARAEVPVRHRGRRRTTVVRGHGCRWKDVYSLSAGRVAAMVSDLAMPKIRPQRATWRPTSRSSSG